MSSAVDDMLELHWLFDMIQTIDVGLVVLNTDYEIQLWNGFMENHSGVTSSKAKGMSLFDIFDDMPADWLKNKLDNVKALKTPFYIAWEQMPHLFPFTASRPITGLTQKMFQNVTLRPITHVDGSIKHLCLVVYDVSDTATSKVSLSTTSLQLNYVQRNDMLTGLKNRPSLEKAMEIVSASHAERQGDKSSLVLMEIDNLRDLQLKHGYKVCDQVLEGLASFLNDSVRAVDVVGRFTSSIFAILLPHINQENAVSYAEALSKRISEQTFSTTDGALSITMGMGIAEIRLHDNPLRDWLGRADQALFNAHENGPNSIKSAE
ncbi:sensor domain-containing diguanylate cyclase [Marinomonas agarivorans]|nr:sensor domain-containing diguanylate cyclase [Marinomonas agarivorans]